MVIILLIIKFGGRELLTPDEVRRLSNDKAILLIRGEKPVIDYKYNILKHPNIKYTADGNEKIYEHGKSDRALATFTKLKEKELEELKNINELQEIKEIRYELLSEEDIENYFLMEEYENERKKENE